MSLQIPAALKDDSTGSEPRSDDEGFMNDTESPVDGIAPDAEAVQLAALCSARDAAEIIKAAEMAESGEASADEENVESCDRWLR